MNLRTQVTQGLRKLIIAKALKSHLIRDGTRASMLRLLSMGSARLCTTIFLLLDLRTGVLFAVGWTSTFRSEARRAICRGRIHRCAERRSAAAGSRCIRQQEENLPVRSGRADLSSLEAARRSRACAYLADDDHGPLALQEILLAGCPTVGVRTGASFVKTGETGVLVDRLPPGRQCVETDADERALAGYLDAIEHAQSMDRQVVRHIAARNSTTSVLSIKSSRRW